MIFFLDIFVFFGFFEFFLIFFLLIRFIRNVIEITTEHKKCHKIRKKSPKSYFLPKGEKNLGRRQKPSAGARSKPA